MVPLHPDQVVAVVEPGETTPDGEGRQPDFGVNSGEGALNER